MPTSSRTKQLTAASIRSLPWPRAVWFPNQTLTGEDAYKVGELIVERVYGGERDTTRGRKQWSLRQLQAQVLHATSPATLVRSIQTYETAKRLGLKPPWRHIETGHLVRVAPLSVAQQKKLLRAAETQGWSVQQLAQKVRKLRGATNQGRRPSPGVVRAIEGLDRKELLSHFERIEELGAAKRRALLKRVAALQEELKTVQKQLKETGN